jgi:phage terminase small subunit
MASRELSEKEKMFADAYLRHMCPRTAALESGYSLPTARGRAYQWVSDREHKPWLYDVIQAGLEAKRGKFSITTQQVLHRLWLIASADPGELVELRRAGCRYCHGEGHGYQWREREFMEELKKSERKGEPMPDYAGGFGYDQSADPVPGCPECSGEGVVQVNPKDTRDLSPGGRALLAGVKQSSQGLEVKLHSQLDALTKIGQHLGMFIDRKELSAPGGGVLFPSLIELVTPSVKPKE